MLPIGPLMIEHRLIERMIRLMENELGNIQKRSAPDPVFLETAVDFIRSYADRRHHGKEENILFRDLQKKSLPLPLRETMEGLIQEHVQGRNAVKKLADAKSRFEEGAPGALEDLTGQIEFLTEFYPKHIDKEDHHFFRPCMDFFTGPEREAMLREFNTFDQGLSHPRYEKIIEEFENKLKS